MKRALLLFVALLKAFYLVALRKALPDLTQCRSSEKRFAFAVLIFAGFFLSAFGDDAKPRVTCYEASVLPAKICKSGLGQFLAALSAAWQSLDEKRSAEFDKLVDNAAKGSAFSPESAAFLKLAYKELSGHNARKSSGMTCYKMSSLGVEAASSREALEKQLKSIEDAKAKGQLSSAASTAAKAAIAKELETLKALQTLGVSGKFDASSVSASPAANEAAAAIVEMQAQPGTKSK